MQIEVFRFWHRDSRVPLTVFAEDLRSAQQLERRWSAAHRGDASTPVIRTELCASGWLDDRPQWRDAVERAQEGVGHWLGHRGGWAIEEPEGMLIASLAPPETPVQFFVALAGDLQDVLIFARDGGEASSLFLQWHHRWFDCYPATFSVRGQSRWTLVGPEAVLREQMDAGLRGIGSWSETEGWQISPIEEAPIEG